MSMQAETCRVCRRKPEFGRALIGWVVQCECRKERGWPPQTRLDAIRVWNLANSR